MGVANERSIACISAANEGADLAFTYLGDALKKEQFPGKSLNSDFTLSCNVENKEEIVKLFQDIKINGVKSILQFMLLPFPIKLNYLVNM